MWNEFPGRRVWLNPPARPKPDLQSGLLPDWLGGGALTLRSRAVLHHAGRREANLQTDSAHAETLPTKDRAWFELAGT